MSVPGREIGLLLRQLDRAFDVRSWHGPNLTGSLRGVDARLAGRRPAPGRHNIAELVLHAAYWKYRVCRMLSEEPPRSFGLAGSDFVTRDNVSDEQWRADLQFLLEWHARLRNAVASFPGKRLAAATGKGGFTFADVIAGAAAHDLYHAGQIQLVKRLCAGG